MKIVINKCFGGFGLSPKVIKRYFELQNNKVFFYVQTEYSFKNGKDLFERKTLNDVINERGIVYTSTTDLGKSFSKWPTKNKSFWFDGDVERDDLVLIKAIEEIGEKESSDYLAELKIVEIPDDVDWEIDEYDGMESVHEKHRSW